MGEDNKVREGLLYLEKKGWSELIDKRWRDDVIAELRNGIPDISDSDILTILDVVLW